MRIVVELKRDAIPQVVLNKLFKHTSLQSTFGYNAVALVDGVPKTLSLLELLRHYLEFQRTVVVRRSKFELRKAEERAHVLEGYLIALDNLDEVIALIRAAEDTDAAREGLMEKFDLSEIQAQAILDLRLRALTALERKRVETGARRPARADRRAPRDPRRRVARHGADPRGAARAQGDLRQERQPPHRDRRTPRASSTSRT